ncbi:MAG: DUF3078 domain-containing protein [Bacteroidales bacterium]|nr:DUF3078 domain-containing protein [Bacteroidales bacterium]
MTKKILLLAALVLMATPIVKANNDGEGLTPTADEPTDTPKGSWTTSSTPALKIGEFIYHNWSATGNSQIDITGTFFGNYKYTHPKFVWDNVADLAYGFAWQDLDNSAEDSVGGRFETRRKSNDKIDLTSALSWKAYKDWGASFTANFKSQFGKGYTYEGIGYNAIATEVSSFMAPAYLTTALSFELKKENWSVSLSFLTGKTTFVYNDSLIANGHTYGVIQEDNFNAADPSTFTHAYFALGSYVKGMYLKKDILPNLDLYARAELFYDYKKPKNMGWSDINGWDGVNDPASTKYVLAEEETWADLQNKNWLGKRAFETDLDFELKLDYRFSKHISANFALNLKWDTDFSGMGNWGHWQIYQMAGVQVFFNWKTPKE